MKTSTRQNKHFLYNNYFPPFNKPILPMSQVSSPARRLADFALLFAVSGITIVVRYVNGLFRGGYLGFT